MVEVRKHQKDMDFGLYDTVWESAEDFKEVLPYLKPKLDGDWNLLIIEPKLDFVRLCLDTAFVPGYIHLVLSVEQSLLEQLYLERPQLLKKEKTRWDIYMDLIGTFPSGIDDKAMRELYYRVGPREDKLAEALKILEQYPYVTIHEVNKHFAAVNRVWSNQVLRAFLLHQHRQAWRLLNMLEQEIGSVVAFYAMRKGIRRLFRDKQRYLHNEDTKERKIAEYSVYDIILLYWLFETAVPEQLYPILYMFERRQPPYADCE